MMKHKELTVLAKKIVAVNDKVMDIYHESDMSEYEIFLSVKELHKASVIAMANWIKKREKSI